jgi:hypothetical protein
VALGTVRQSSGFYTGMGPNKILVSLWDMVPTLSGACLLLVFGLCILNFLVKFVSSHLNLVKLQMSLMEMKMTYYCGPSITPRMVKPDVGLFIASCQQEAVDE